MNIENDLLTKYNVDTFLQKIKILLNPYKSKIKTVDEFPFKELFSKVIVESRNNIIFVIGKHHNFKDANINQPGILIGEIDYLIRKTTFTSKHRIIFF